MSLCRIGTKNMQELFVRGIISPKVLSYRNTFIVKRKIPPPLSKLRAERPRILKGRHFIYETVEDTDLTDPPDIPVVLTTFVDGIGDVGEVISAMPAYVREHLLLPRKAVYATPENIEKYTNLKKTRLEIPKFSSINAGMTVRILSKVVIPLFMSPQVSWTLEANHVYVAFRTEEFHVPVDTIELPVTPIDGPDPEKKEGGDFAVHVTINNTERVPVRCRIFHLTRGLETTKLSEDIYLDKGQPILEEQKDLLESMPMPEIINDPASSISLIEKYRIQYIN